MEKKERTSRDWAFVAVLAITVAALLLRLWGIRWGLPNSLHSYTYHPDEIFQLGAMTNVNPFTLTLDPGFYNYPSGYINLGSAAIRLVGGYGIDLNIGSAYVIARILTVLLSAASVPLVYLIAVKLYGRAAGLLAALLLAIMPLHIVHSHFATVDVPAAFWVAAALLGATAVMNKPTLKLSLLAGALAGFAAGTKYNAALVLIPVLAALFISPERKDVKDSQLTTRNSQLTTHNSQLVLAALGAFIVGFIVSTPGFVLWPDKFVGGLLYEIGHASSGHGLVFQGRGPGWLVTLTDSFGYGLGIFLLLGSLVAVIFALVRRKPADWLILSFIIPYFILIALSKVHFTRYAVPLLPPLAILVGRLIADVYLELKNDGAMVLRLAWVAVAAAAGGYTFIYAIAFDRLFTPSDPRDAAAEWFNMNVTAGTTVAFPTVPWFYSPPLAPGIIGAIGQENRCLAMLASKYHLITNPDMEWDRSLLDSQAKYFVVSDFEYEDLLRLREKNAKAFFDDLNRSFVPMHTFKKRFSAFGINFGPTEYLPHDLKYMSPTIKVYRRK